MSTSASNLNVNPNAGVGANTNAPSTGAAEAYAAPRANNIRNLSWGYVKERASRMVDQLESRVSPTTFNGLIAGTLGALLAGFPSMFMMLFKFKTWQDYFIGYVLFSLAAAGNVVFAEKGTPKELLIVAGIAVHFALSFLYGTLMARWTDNTRDAPTIVLRSVLLSIGMHYFNLVFVPKVWNMQLLRDYLDYTGFFPHLLDHIAFGLIVGSTLAALKSRGGLRGIRSSTGGILTSLANNADRLRTEVTGKVQEAAHAVAPSMAPTSTTTTSSSTSSSNAPGTAPSTTSSATAGLPSVGQIRSAVEHAVGSAKDTVTAAVNQQIPSTAGKGDTFKSGTTPTTTSSSAGAPSTSSAANLGTTAIPPPTRAPYLDAATSGGAYAPKDTAYRPEESSANPVPSTTEKKRV